ncbi:hypothetical protein RND81_08G127300 [Saponaria officinalis]|uniref:Bet v I/Major latex protein domain-containing protein n=1 Tax=Saponaria officinalis TaxID=3572 RepID=A0AAW1J5T7_SAPOF
MGVTGKLEIEVDIKSSGDSFHELIGTNPHHLSNITPDKIHACDLHEGDFGQPGSIVQFDYTCDGKKCVAKEIIEEINEEKKLVRYKMIEGSTLLEDFKSMIVTMQVIPKGEIDAIMWTFEFEKLADIGPYPIALMDLAICVTRDIEAHHLT